MALALAASDCQYGNPVVTCLSDYGSNIVCPVETVELGSGPSKAKLQHQELGTVAVALQFQGSPHQSRRTPGLIARSSVEYLGLLIHQGAPGVIDQGGRQTTMHPGGLTIYDWTRPSALTFPSSIRSDVLLIERDAIDLHSRRLVELTARTFPTQQGTAAVVRSLLTGLVPRLRACPPAAAHRLGSCDPGAKLREAHQALLTGELAAPAAAAPGPVSSLVPRQLLSDIDRFTGRAGDLAVLDALLPNDGSGDDRPTVIAAVVGTAGIGKSAFAVHWAHRVKQRFPHGQLYLNLHGFGSARAIEPLEAVDTMLRSLGIPADQIPAGLDSRSALLRTILAERRILVVLDNARDSDHVRPLLPGSGAFVLVTSRRQLRGLAARDGAHRVMLDHLSEGESSDLLERIIGERARAEPSAISELVVLCGGLPLALALAAERATREPTWRLAALIDELRDERDRLDALSGDEDRAPTCVSNITQFAQPAHNLSTMAAPFTAECQPRRTVGRNGWETGWHQAT